MQDASVESELRAMARTQKVPQSVVVSIRTSEVRARDGEGPQRSLLSRQKTAKGQVAGGIALAPVGHLEGGALRRVETYCCAFRDFSRRFDQGYTDLARPLVRASRRK